MGLPSSCPQLVSCAFLQQDTDVVTDHTPSVPIPFARTEPSNLSLSLTVMFTCANATKVCCRLASQILVMNLENKPNRGFGRVSERLHLDFRCVECSRPPYLQVLKSTWSCSRSRVLDISFYTYHIVLPAGPIKCYTSLQPVPVTLPWHFHLARHSLLQTLLSEVLLPLIDWLKVRAWSGFLTRLSGKLHAWAPALLGVWNLTMDLFCFVETDL